MVVGKITVRQVCIQDIVENPSFESLSKRLADFVQSWELFGREALTVIRKANGR